MFLYSWHFFKTFFPSNLCGRIAHPSFLLLFCVWKFRSKPTLINLLLFLSLVCVCVLIARLWERRKIMWKSGGNPQNRKFSISDAKFCNNSTKFPCLAANSHVLIAIFPASGFNYPVWKRKYLKHWNFLSFSPFFLLLLQFWYARTFLSCSTRMRRTVRISERTFLFSRGRLLSQLICAKSRETTESCPTVLNDQMRT